MSGTQGSDRLRVSVVLGLVELECSVSRWVVLGLLGPLEWLWEPACVCIDRARVSGVENCFLNVMNVECRLRNSSLNYFMHGKERVIALGGAAGLRHTAR